MCDKWINNPKAFYDWAINNGHSEDLQIDRINNDKGYSPDNCRFVTRSINCVNRTKKDTNTSGFTGVTFDKKYKKWSSRISLENKRTLIGFYDSKKEAAKARDLFIIENKYPHNLQTDEFLKVLENNK